MTQRTIKDIINDSKVYIPSHQRPYIWTEQQANRFLITIMDGMPTLSLILYEEVKDGKLVRSLEDGQQRFMSLRKFYKGEIEGLKWDNKKFVEFSQDEKSRFENYPLTITTMENVVYERREILFQDIQRGTPLTDGHRFHASTNSPLVKFAYLILRNEACDSVWGGPPIDDPKKKSLENAVAIASGLSFLNIDAITSSYNIIGTNGLLEKPINESEAMERLNKLISVYKRADELCTTTAAKKKPQRNVGKYTGYILYCMCLPERNWEADKEMFAKFIARVRTDKLAMNILTFKKPTTRNWNSARWKQGVENLENPKEVERALILQGLNINEDSEDEDST